MAPWKRHQQVEQRLKLNLHRVAQLDLHLQQQEVFRLLVCRSATGQRCERLRAADPLHLSKVLSGCWSSRLQDDD
jgi:hypothetical protein